MGKKGVRGFYRATEGHRRPIWGHLGQSVNKVGHTGAHRDNCEAIRGLKLGQMGPTKPMGSYREPWRAKCMSVIELVNLRDIELSLQLDISHYLK